MMRYKNKQLKELESIIACIYYLSEESYRCGLDNVGLALRASIAFIEDNGSVTKDDKDTQVSEAACNNSLLELLDTLDMIKKLTPEMKLTALRFIEKTGSDEIH